VWFIYSEIFSFYCLVIVVENDLIG